MTVEETSLPGLLLVNLDIFPDERGSFREVWQAEKMEALGLPQLHPVQCNISETVYGGLRGIHADPWDKYVHVAYGTAFVALVDLREGEPTFGKYLTFEASPSRAIFVPKGFGNSIQATSEKVVYVYLVTAHWKPGLTYPAVAFDDPDLAIPWPIGGEKAIISDKDRKNPTMRQAYPDWHPS